MLCSLNGYKYGQERKLVRMTDGIPDFCNFAVEHLANQ